MSKKIELRSIGDMRPRLEQMSVNCDFLLKCIDQIHECLCPGQNGNWQDRAKQAVEASKNVRRVSAKQKAALNRISQEISIVLEDK